MTNPSELDLLSSHRRTGFNLFRCCLPKENDDEENDVRNPDSSSTNIPDVQDRGFDLPDLQEEPAPAQKKASNKTNNVLYSLIELIFSIFILNMGREQKKITNGTVFSKENVNARKESREGKKEEMDDENSIPDLVIN
mmetsp:Transcript_17340/g.26275  ORF Transcript_17340/g.26275 Transcript_17340/m.26275 type:complete len:138 (-) Transcript_17340:271-684(-)